MYIFAMRIIKLKIHTAPKVYTGKRGRKRGRERGKKGGRDFDYKIKNYFAARDQWMFLEWYLAQPDIHVSSHLRVIKVKRFFNAYTYPVLDTFIVLVPLNKNI